MFAQARANQGWVVQRWVKVNSGLSKNYSSICFSNEKISVLIKYRSEFFREKLVHPKFTAQIRLFKVGNKTMS